MCKLTLLTVSALLYLTAYPAYAYIGPGAGVGAVAVVFGIIGSLILALIAILWYPIKRLFKGRKSKKNEREKEQADVK
ncbi:MAG: hypothetical protein ABW185_29275 [Sedimenticola sp.]